MRIAEFGMRNRDGAAAPNRFESKSIPRGIILVCFTTLDLHFDSS
jgi:hypothetical protein